MVALTALSSFEDKKHFPSEVDTGSLDIQEISAGLLSRNDLRPCSEDNVVQRMPYVVDLCCGMGGLAHAARQLGMRVVAGVDINADALKTFARNFPGARAITGSVDNHEVLHICDEILTGGRGEGTKTVVVSGPPCQGFSPAGSRDPDDERNTILLAVCQAISRLQPTCGLIENVPTVLSPKYRDLITILYSTLTDAGYHVFPVVVDASDYGLAQIRKRSFFLLTRQELCSQLVADGLEARKVPSMTSSKALEGLLAPSVRPDKYHDEEDIGIPPNHFAMCHTQAVKDKIARIAPGSGPMSYRRLHSERPSNTLFSGHRAPSAHFSEPRSITVREAARLQGFEDTFRIYGAFSNQMAQVTNAVPPPLARVVLSLLLELTGIQIYCHV